MADIDLIATKNFSYATRRLRAGDQFTVDPRMAKVLVAIGKAAHHRAPGRVSPPTSKQRQQLDHDGNGKPGGSSGAVDHMRAVRAEYEALVGKRPFPGWDEPMLREKMAAYSAGNPATP